MKLKLNTFPLRMMTLMVMRALIMALKMILKVALRVTLKVNQKVRTNDPRMTKSTSRTYLILDIH